MNTPLFKTSLLAICFLPLSFFGCESADGPQNTENVSPCLPDSMTEMITTGEVQMQQVYQKLTLPGEITVNRDRVFRVTPTAGGLISDVYVSLGDRVEKGQALATVQSPDIAEFNRDKQSALADKSLAERNLRMAESMYESGVYSQRDLLEARKSLERATAEVERLRERQNVLGLAEGDTVYTIRAPENGFVVERNINPGVTLQANDDLAFEISDLRDVWVVANVAESEIRNIRTNTESTITTLAYPDQSFSGEIVRLSSTINPVRRTMEAIIELPNPDFLLRPGMFANIEVLAGESDSLPTIESGALIFVDNDYFVVVYSDPCDVEVRPVTISSQTEDNAFIASGVDEGESIVTDRQLLIYNELTENR